MKIAGTVSSDAISYLFALPIGVVLWLSGCTFPPGPQSGPSASPETQPKPRTVSALSPSEAQLIALQAEREQLMATLDDYHERVKDLEGKLADQKVTESMDDLLRKKEAELAAARQAVEEKDELGHQLRNAHVNSRQLQGRVIDLEAQVAARDQELTTLRERLRAAGDFEATARRVTKLEAQLADYNQKLQAVGNLTEERGRLVDQIGKFVKTVDQANQRAADLEAQLKEKDQVLESLRAQHTEQVTKTSELASITSDLTHARAQVSKLEAQLKEATEQLDRFREVAEERKKLLAQLTDRNGQLSQARQLMAALETQLSAKQKELAQLRLAAPDTSDKRPTPQPASAQPARSVPAALSPAPASADQHQRGTNTSRDTETLGQLLQAAAGNSDLAVKEQGNRLTLQLSAGLLFAPGEATLKQNGVDVLKRIGQVLREFPEKSVQVAGHTDNQPLRRALKKKFPTNKALSYARAENARRALINGGLHADRVRAVGFADKKPIATNRTEDGRKKNRRVEITVR